MPRCFTASAIEIHNNLATRHVIAQRAIAVLQNLTGPEQLIVPMEEVLHKSRMLELSLGRFIRIARTGLYIGSEIVEYAEEYTRNPSSEYLNELLDISGFKF